MIKQQKKGAAHPWRSIETLFEKKPSVDKKI